ncbi:hypothetical protein MCOR25_001206 [Pyricularia grisea]|nr:hypothetical protein MCOR25_001206 [Pyricularia grisea]
MPFIPNTPESLLARNDSKNPSTTCRGITSSGRACRRSLAANSDGSSAPSTPPRRRRGNLRVDDPSDESLYCWQHKEQASMSAHSSPGPRASHTPILEERTSIDTLADRLGLLDVTQKPSKRPAAVDGSSAGTSNWGEKKKMTRPKPKTQSLSFCCCFTIPITEVSEDPPPRPKPRPLQSAPAVNQGATTPTRPGRQSNQHLTPNHSSRPSRSSLPGTPSSGPRRSRHSSTASATSQTAQFMSLIPPSASPEVASRLLAELAKPVSDQDDAGYIYMFWLTPTDVDASPPVDAARSLLAPPSKPGGRSRRPSDVLASFASATADPKTNGKKKTILLKIGRATNVQRRLNEWTRQCGYDLSLIRYYPYIPSSSPGASPSSARSSASLVPRKVPHSHKVERLVHIELQGLGLRVADREKCDSCGREHREWFEVDASRKGVEEVDQIIRRWADWDEGRA